MRWARRVLGWGVWCGVGVVVAAGGCNQTDRDCLTRATRRVAAQFEWLRQHAPRELEAAPLVSEPLTPVGKVRVRIQSDRYLRPLGLRVSGEGTSVTLAGEVPDEAYRVRAVELAQSTVGVEQVVDQLHCRPPAARP
jgi:hypothetical protein